MLKIYGWKRSRTIRCVWTLEELGLDYEQIPLNPNAGETQTAEYLALNPSGKIPTLAHDDFVLTETTAINFYLASTFSGSLLPPGALDLAKLHQWTSWALTELEPPLVSIFREGRRAEDKIDRARIEAWHADVQRPSARCSSRISRNSHRCCRVPTSRLRTSRCHRSRAACRRSGSRSRDIRRSQSGCSAASRVRHGSVRRRKPSDDVRRPPRARGDCGTDALQPRWTLARASVCSACRRCGISSIWPSSASVATPGLSRNSAMTRVACAISSALGRKHSLMTATWSG